MIQIQETVHCGDHLALCPQAKLDDGLMDLMVSRHQSRATFIAYVDKANQGKHVDFEMPCPQPTAVGDYIQVSSVVVRPVVGDKRKQPQYLVGQKTVNIDGELVGSSPFRVTVLPLALRIFA